MIGTRLGSYEITAKLGEGGMGEVYRATDTKLKRDVAIKVLPAAFTEDKERLARFEREAQLLAQLNHPNIAAIYALEKWGQLPISGPGSNASKATGKSETVPIFSLVMELVEGPTLAERLEHGPLSFNESLSVSLQIAQALEEAHEKGIVHRDLKPQNIKASVEGKVKVLDFGLAKVMETALGFASAHDMAHSPTVTFGGTREGVILGTAAYMAPEQARGGTIDKRADIWAFGVVLYEMLSGERLFAEGSVVDTLSAVMRKPIDFEALPAATPARLRDLVRRCLEREPKQRLRDIGEARIALSDGRTDDPLSAAIAPRGRAWRTVVALALGSGIISFLALWLAHPWESRSPIRRIEFPVENLRADFWTSPLISPDGQRLAWIQNDLLRIKRLDDLATVDLDLLGSGGEGSWQERFFWSADSVNLGFAIGKRLWRVPAVGGTPLAVCDIPDSGGIIGGDWGRDDVIVFSTWRGTLYRVSATGGRPEVLLALDPKVEVDFHQPKLLPGGRGLLFTPHWRELGRQSIDALANGKRQVALKEGSFTFSHAVYASSGHVLFDNEDEEGLWAVPFSISSLRATGKPFLVVRDGSHSSLSADGTLVYVRGAVAPSGELVWVTAAGSVVGSVGPAMRGLSGPTLSPDGRQIAVSAWESNQFDLWLEDLARGTRSRLTSTPESELRSVWAPSGDRILFVQSKGVTSTLRSISPSGAGGERTLTGSSKVMTGIVPPDERQIVFASDDSGGGVGHVWGVAADRQTEQQGDAQALMSAPVLPGFRVAPQGDFIAYTSGEGAPSELFLRGFPSGETSWQVSSGGGRFPRWSRTGDLLYFVAGDAMMEVEVHRTPAFALGTPRKLFSLAARRLRGSSEFDVDAGGRLLMVRDTGEPLRIVVAINGERLLENGGKVRP